MNSLRVDIENLVLSGLAMDPARGRRLARLTEMALERLLRQRGVPVQFTSDLSRNKAKGQLAKTPPDTDESRWAEELAQAVYRALDRVL